MMQQRQSGVCVKSLLCCTPSLLPSSLAASSGKSLFGGTYQGMEPVVIIKSNPSRTELCYV